MKEIILLLLSVFVFYTPSLSSNHSRLIHPDSISFTILYNDLPLNDSLIGDQGFSCLIEFGGNSYLFDAGRIADILRKNTETMGVDCSLIDHIFISHLHSDHFGGLPGIIQKCNKPGLHLPYSLPKTQSEQGRKYILESLKIVEPNTSVISWNKESVKINENVYSTGMIEEQSYEQALIITTTKGLIVLVGCSHPGIVEIVQRAKSLMKQDVYFVMGGFHLAVTDSEVVQGIANELRGLTKFIAPCHCTGNKAQEIFYETFKEDYIEIKTGLRFTLNKVITK